MKFMLGLSLVVSVLGGNTLLPAFPLALKTPYLAAYLPGADSASAATSQPMFWNGNPLTWKVLARVGSETYALFGCANETVTPAEQVDIEYTSTRTTITLQAATIKFTLDFFSPVSPIDYVRQSMPYSYLTVSASNVPVSSAVYIMTAIDDSWTAQSPETQATFSKTKQSSFFTLSGTDSTEFTEDNDMATWGKFVLAAASRSRRLTYQIGSADTVLSDFEATGTLGDQSAAYTSGDLVAFSYRLPKGRRSSSITFAVGLEQDLAIQFLSELETGYYHSLYDTTEDVVDHFFADEVAARTEGAEFDARVVSMGQAISTNYSDILEATVRLVWGGLEVVIPAASKDTTQVKAFMKEISTDGNVNTLADLLPKAFPAFYTLAPEYMRLLLEPVMQYSLVWPANYAVHDLGKHYPNATGETVAGEEQLIVDQTSVILWMAYAYQKASGNTEWIKPYVPTMQVYADYLVGNGLYPASQRSSVDAIGGTANQTILAIYSAIGLTSFGALTGQANYTAKGKEFANTILELGTSQDGTHILTHYNDPDSSWASMYPFAWDKLTGLGTFNESTYALESAWYEGELHPFGMPFYDGVNYTVSDLSLWCAATSSAKVRDALIDAVHMEYTSNLTSVPGPTQWNVVGAGIGAWKQTKAKAIAGSYFMPAAVLQATSADHQT